MGEFDKDRIEFENRKYRDSITSEKDSENIFHEKPYERQYPIKGKDLSSDDRMPIAKDAYYPKKKNSII